MRVSVSTLACIGALLVASAAYPAALLAGASGPVAGVGATGVYLCVKLLLRSGVVFQLLASEAV